MNTLQLVEMFIDSDWRKSTSGNVFVRCPSPDHHDSKPSCHLSIDKKVFNCFSCGARGSLAKALKWKRAPDSIINLVAQMPDSPFIGREAVKSALLDEVILSAYANKPQKWIDAGFEECILSDHQIGYDKINNRITIPIRDLNGGLVAIVGRNDSDFNKYKVYKSELGDFEPRPYMPKVHDHLWRADKLDHDMTDPIVVVEGYKACMWLVQCGYLPTVALLGARISDAQVELLSSFGRPVILMLDNDEAGRKGQQDAEIKLYRKGLNVKTATYVVDVKQPDYLNPTDTIVSVLNAKEPTWIS